MTRSVFREKEYFDEYISEKTELYKKVETKINNGTLSGSKLAYAKRGQLYNLYNQFVAKYSRGDKITELKPYFSKIVNGLTNESWEENFLKFTYSKHKKIIVTNQPSLDFHNLLLNILSIGILIDGEKKDFESLRKFVEFNTIEYKLFDIFINFRIKEHPIKESKYSLKQYNKLEELVEPILPDEKKIIIYQKKWFHSLSPTYFHIDSTTKNGMFDGYWCFESAALAKVFSYSVEELLENIYFPTDLFNINDNVFEYKISLEIKLLNSIDKTMRDVEKNWRIKNPSNEILISRRILQTHNKRRYVELEEQINSYFTKLEDSSLSTNKEQILLNKSLVIQRLIELLKCYDIIFLLPELETEIEPSRSDLKFWSKFKSIWS